MITFTSYAQKDVVWNEIWDNIDYFEWIPFEYTLNYKTTTQLPKPQIVVGVFTGLERLELKKTSEVL